MRKWFRRKTWRLRVRVRRWWDLKRAPWPVVGECHLHRDGSTCPQCDGSHEHEWVAWPQAPSWIASGGGVPVRCRVCGARKCDNANCTSRRHHRDPHIGYDGSILKVGV